MQYENITRAIFFNRPNRFIAEVDRRTKGNCPCEKHRKMQRTLDSRMRGMAYSTGSADEKQNMT